MKLGRLKKILSVLVIVGSLSGNILAKEVATQTATSVATTLPSQVAMAEATAVAIAEAERMEEPGVQYIREQGEYINKSVVKGNIKVTVEYLLADAYTYKMLLAVEQVDGAPFKVVEGIQIKNMDFISAKELEQQKVLEAVPKDAPFSEYIKVMAQFDENLKAYIKADGTVDEKGLIAYWQLEGNVVTGTASSSYGNCFTKENSPSKQYFIYQGNFSDPMDQEMILVVDGIYQQEDKSYDLAVDLEAYLNAHKEDEIGMIANQMDQSEKDYLEELKLKNEALYLERMEELEGQPKLLLAEKSLKLQVIQDETDITIDNIGFINEQLHIFMVGEGEERYNLEVYDALGEWIGTAYNVGRSTTQEDGTKVYQKYYAYDIKDIEALKDYTFKVSGREVVEEIDDTWEIKLDLSEFLKAQVIKVDEDIQYTTEEKAHLSEVSLMKLSLSLTLDGVKEGIDNRYLGMSVKLKDGTVKDVGRVRASSHQGDKQVLIYNLEQGMDSRQIQGLIIGETEINLVS